MPMLPRLYAGRSVRNSTSGKSTPPMELHPIVNTAIAASSLRKNICPPKACRLKMKKRLQGASTERQISVDLHLYVGETTRKNVRHSAHVVDPAPDCATGSPCSPSAPASLAIRPPNSTVSGDSIQHSGEFDIGLDVLEPVFAKPGVQRQCMPPGTREQRKGLHVGESRGSRRDILTLELFKSLGGFDHDLAIWMFDKRPMCSQDSGFLSTARTVVIVSSRPARCPPRQMTPVPEPLPYFATTAPLSRFRGGSRRLPGRSQTFHVPASGRQG